MWLKRKPKNRRLRHERVLDVKLRSQQRQANRARLAATLVTVCFALLLIALTVWRGGEWMLNRLIYENDAFAIQQIDVQTDGIISIEQLKNWAQVKPRDNLLALDLVRIKRDLELEPLIRSAAVERTLPGTLRIRVAEREPIAQAQAMHVSTDGQYQQIIYHIDEEGCLMRPLDPRLRSAPPAYPYEYLPFISGIPQGDLRPGGQIQSPQIRAALQLIAQFDYSPMSGLADLYRIDVSAAETLQVFTSQGNQLTFALDRLDVQLNRWRLVHDHFQRQGKAIASLDLSIANSVPLHLMDAGDPPPDAPKNIKPIRTRKKNV